VTRNDNLFRRVDIGRFANLAIRRIAANGGYSLELHAENRRHRPDTDGNCFLHVLAAMAYRANRVGEAEGSGGNVCGVLAQAMAADEAGLETLFVQHAPRRDGCGENRGLRDLGQAKLIFRTFEAKLRELVAESLVRFFKRLPGYRMFFGEVFAHAHGLRSLAWEKKCEFTGGCKCHSYAVKRAR